MLVKLACFRFYLVRATFVENFSISSKSMEKGSKPIYMKGFKNGTISMASIDSALELLKLRQTAKPEEKTSHKQHESALTQNTQKYFIVTRNCFMKRFQQHSAGNPAEEGTCGLGVVFLQIARLARFISAIE